MSRAYACVMPAFSEPPAFSLSDHGTRHEIRVDALDFAGPRPVLLCLDGDDQFPILREARASLVGAHPELAAILIAGIGYGASYRQPGNRRARDYTPVPIEGAPDGGGADAFLDFIQTALWPELVRRYPVHPDIRGIAGHSLGALFALHALFRPAPFFNRILASAPSLWWGDRVLLRQAAGLRDRQATLPARVHLSVGLRDSASMTGDLDLLETQLAERPFSGLDVIRERFPRKNHFNSIDPAFRTGLAALFAFETV